MKNLILAFCIAIFTMVILFLLFTSLGIDKTTVGSFSSVVLGGIPMIHKTLNKSKEKKLNPQISKKRFVPFANYTLSFKLLLVYSFLLYIATMQLVGGLIGWMVVYNGGNLLNMQDHEAVLLLIIIIPICFFIGRWIGIKSSKKGVILVLLSVFLARFSVSCIDHLILPTDHFELIVGDKPSLDLFIFQISVGWIFLSVCSLLGYWRGKRKQLISYFGYLIARVEPSIRKTIIELAFEEAERSEK